MFRTSHESAYRVRGSVVSTLFRAPTRGRGLSPRLIAALLIASQLSAAERYRASEPHMGTLVTITLFADSPEQAQQGFVAAFARIGELNRLLSDYDPGTELSQACSLATPVSRELIRVVSFAQTVAAETDGAFDITVGPLSRLWRAARRAKHLPTNEEIRSALGLTGFRKLALRDGRIVCQTPGMALDAGGIAKGFAADEAVAALERMGVRSALVAMSGDIVAGDPPPGEAGWKVSAGGLTRTIANSAVSTSGDEFQYIEIGGVRYSHIIDPRTGFAVQNSRPVSVWAKTGIEADSLATAVSVGGPGLIPVLKSKRKVEIFTGESR